MKIEKRWVFAFLLVSAVAITGLFWPEVSTDNLKTFNPVNTINYADVAWLLTASCLVLLMTPGLSFFYGGMVGKKKCDFHHAQKLYLLGRGESTLGCSGFFAIIWQSDWPNHQRDTLRHHWQPI